MATLLGIAIKRRKYAPMELLPQVQLTPEAGLAGDYRGAPGKRQVTLLSLVDWQRTCGELGVDLSWQERRANLLVDELPLFETRGALITLGGAVLEVTGETDPCERMEAVQPGLFNALASAWRGGVTCRVREGGLLTLGMNVSIALRPE
ncbi:MAG TPA: MOSC domain-containing protein [Gammaproteobacteria bacterium]